MTTRRSSLAVIFAIVFVDLVGFGIVIPVLPLYAERFGASPLVIGLLLSVYSMMQAIFAPLLGRLSDRVGRRPVLLVSLVGTSIGFLIMGLAQTLSWLFVARIVDGITGGNISTAQAYIADVTPPEHRSRGMGLIGAGFGLGLIFGPAIGGILSHLSLAAPFLFAAALAACNAVGVYFLLPESRTAQQRSEVGRHASVLQFFKKPHGRALAMITATYFFTTVAFSLLTATYALFTERRFGYSALHNGYIFASQGVIGAVIQGALMGWLVRFLSDKALTIAGTMALALSLVALPMSATETALFLATAGVAIGHALVAAPLNGLASKAVGPEAQGRVLGLMQSAASLARITGPVLGGWLLGYDALHAAAPFGQTPYWVGAGFMLVAVALATAL